MCKRYGYKVSFIHVSCVFYNALRDHAKGTTTTYCLLTVDQHRLLIGRNLPAPPILWARQHRLSPVHHQYSHLICKMFRQGISSIWHQFHLTFINTDACIITKIYWGAIHARLKQLMFAEERSALTSSFRSVSRDYTLRSKLLYRKG